MIRFFPTRRVVSARAAIAVVLGALALSRTTSATAETFDCVMEASLIVKVGSAIPSVVTDVLVDRGDVVEKGQVLAHIQSAVEELTVEHNKARAESAAEIEAKQAVLNQKTGILHRKQVLQGS